VAVPEIDAPSMQAGATPTVTLDEYPGQVLHGTLVRNSAAINPASRTLLVEVDVDNAQGKLLPGPMCSSNSCCPGARSPSRSLRTPCYFAVKGVVRNGKAVLVPITIGRDYGDRVEVLSSLHPRTRSSSIHPTR
jgi:multidrug efflux pump subunit AcrA (membrane-fusion protein)